MCAAPNSLPPFKIRNSLFSSAILERGITEVYATGLEYKTGARSRLGKWDCLYPIRTLNELKINR